MGTFVFEASGKLVPPTVEELAEADREAAVLCYTTGEMNDGRHYYAYIAVIPSRYREFMQKTTAREIITLGDYGTVIVADFQTEAPPDVKQEMHEKYGFDDSYQEKIIQRVYGERNAFMKAKEEKRIMDIVLMLKKQTSSSNKP